LAQAEQASQPTPEQQQMQQQAAQAQMAFQQSQTAALNGQAVESEARAQKIAVETQLAPQELQIDQIKAVTANLKAGDQEDKEFERRMKIAQTFLKEKEIDLKNQPQQQQAPQPVQPMQPLQLQQG